MERQNSISILCVKLSILSITHCTENVAWKCQIFSSATLIGTAERIAETDLIRKPLLQYSMILRLIQFHDYVKNVSIK